MADNKEDEKSKKGRVPKYVSAGLLVALVGSYFLLPSFQAGIDEAWQVLTSDDRQRIETWVSGFGWWGPLVVIVAMVVQMFLVVVPSLALMVVSIVAYGPIWGSLIVLLAVYVASTVGYFIGSYFGETVIDGLIGSKNEASLEKFIENYGFWAVVITRINPFLSNDAISFVAGILQMGYWRFIAATILGIAPLTLFVAILGDSTKSLENGLLWGSLVSLVIFGAYIYWDKKKNG
jgi:uncharacterized membrane protein YdjX (TVP38/TMEM64 family)